MRSGDRPPVGPDQESAVADLEPSSSLKPPTSVIVTEVSPFHCLYQDALEFHSQSRLMLVRSVGASSRLARASLLLYVSAAESLVHQAITELARPEVSGFLADPSRPIRLEDVIRLLPAVVGDGHHHSVDLSSAPWPQLFELLALQTHWSYPGPASSRRAYYRRNDAGTDYEPLQPHQVPAGLGISSEQLRYPLTGLPRDPYSLRPHHLDTVRGILDGTVVALDRILEGALTRENRHRREPIRVIR